MPSARVALFSVTPPQPATAAQPRPPHQPASPPTRPTRPGSKRPYDNLETPIPGDELDDEDENGTKPLAPTDISLEVICNNVHAVLNPATCKVVHEGREMTATQFEQFAGCGSAKKWKASLRILPGQVPECPRGMPPHLLPCVIPYVQPPPFAHFFRLYTVQEPAMCSEPVRQLVEWASVLASTLQGQRLYKLESGWI